MEYEDPNMDGEAIELQVIKKEDLEALSRIWTQLDERTRYLLEGYYILNLPAAEMARELNIKPASLRMALTRARKTAYQLLQDKSRQ
jgi:sigma-70, region 4